MNNTHTHDMSVSSTKSDEGSANLPLNRVKTIMKSSPDIANISQEGLYCMTKATELFIMLLLQRTYEQRSGKKTVDYKDLSNFVQESEELEFLHEIIPNKLKAREVWRLIQAEENESS